jgi:pimeloyl-ACP methyl ester carboxylesterase
MRRALIVLLALAALLLLVPLIIPVPPLQGTVPPEELADADSRFIDVNGLRMHYKTQGQGEPALVLLHGFAASTFSWQAVMPQLSVLGTTVAFDRPAFGLTERPMPGEWEGENPYSLEAQADQTVALMDRLGIEQGVLVGNSAGGTVALLTALRYPDRVQALVLVDAAIYGSGTPAWLGPVLRTPQMRHLGPLVARSLGKMGGRLLDSAWYDKSKVTDAVLEGYEKPLRAQNWDRALWEFTIASRPMHLETRLGEVRVPVLVVTGEYDRIVPPEQSARLSEELPDAELVTIPDCGHVPQEECPEAFVAAVSAFLGR